MLAVQEEAVLVTALVLLGKVVLKVVSSELFPSVSLYLLETIGIIPLGVESLGVEAREVSSYFLFLRNGRSLSDPESTKKKLFSLLSAGWPGNCYLPPVYYY